MFLSLLLDEFSLSEEDSEDNDNDELVNTNKALNRIKRFFTFLSTKIFSKKRSNQNEVNSKGFFLLHSKVVFINFIPFFKFYSRNYRN